MKKILSTLPLLFILSSSAFAQLTFLTRSTPEEVGISSKDVLAFTDTLMRWPKTYMHSVMVMRNGKVIAEKYNEPFAANYSHTLYSCSKTFTGVAVGLAIEDSLLSLTDSLVKFVPEMLPAVVSDSLRAITVRDLLTMTSGLPVNTTMRTREKEWIRAYLAQQMVALPGTRYAYDSIDSYLLSAIVQKVTGMTVFQLLKKRIFTPMGITQVAWEESPEGISCGGWGLYLQLESMAKFGQLILQKGMWDGKQLVNAGWIDQMVQHQSTNTNGTKYGYHIWLTKYPGMVKADGAYGQFIYIIPDKQMVVAITQCNYGGSPSQDKEVWEMSRKAGSKPLNASKEYNILKTARYRLTPTRGRATSTSVLRSLELTLGNNKLDWKSIEFDFTKQMTKHIITAEVTTTAGKKFDIVCDYQNWHLNEIKGYPLNLRPFVNNFSNIKPPFYVGASYGWTTDNDLYLRLHYVNWLSSCRLHFHFNKGVVTAEILSSDTEKNVRIDIKDIKR